MILVVLVQPRLDALGIKPRGFEGWAEDPRPGQLSGSWLLGVGRSYPEEEQSGKGPQDEIFHLNAEETLATIRKINLFKLFKSLFHLQIQQDHTVGCGGWTL